MLRLALPHAFGSGVGWYRLAGDERPPEESLADLRTGFAAFPLPFDAVLLGMGTDGHVASLFPDDPQVETLFAGSDRLGVARPPSQPTPRISLTAAALTETRSLELLIAGSDKRRVVEAALSGEEDRPVARLLANCNSPITIHWTP